MKMQMLQIQIQEMGIKELKAEERIIKILEKFPMASQIEIIESISGKCSLQISDIDENFPNGFTDTDKYI